jgi:hypothetical protein
MVVISGRVHDSNNKPLLEDILVEAFEHALLLSSLSRQISPAVATDLRTGYFKIVPIHSFGLNIKKTYLLITDPNKRFECVREGQKEFTQIKDDHGNVKWKSQIIDDIGNIDITGFVLPQYRYLEVCKGHSSNVIITYYNSSHRIIIEPFNESSMLTYSTSGKCDRKLK